MTEDDIAKQLREIQLWQAEHDGRINAYWETQHAWNKEHVIADNADHAKFEAMLSRLDHRMSAVEKRIVWLSAMAAAAGSALGQFIPAFTG